MQRGRHVATATECVVCRLAKRWRCVYRCLVLNDSISSCTLCRTIDVLVIDDTPNDRSPYLLGKWHKSGIYETCGPVHDEGEDEETEVSYTIRQVLLMHQSKIQV